MNQFVKGAGKVEEIFCDKAGEVFSQLYSTPKEIKDQIEKQREELNKKKLDILQKFLNDLGNLSEKKEDEEND